LDDEGGEVYLFIYLIKSAAGVILERASNNIGDEGFNRNGDDLTYNLISKILGWGFFFIEDF